MGWSRTTACCSDQFLAKSRDTGKGSSAGALLAVALIVLGVMALFRPAAAVPFAVCLALAAFVNRGLYRLFYRKGGVSLLIGGFLLQNLYYLYLASALVIGIALGTLKRCSEVLKVPDD